MVQYAFMAIGLLVTFLNVLVFLALRRRLVRAFPARETALTMGLAAAMLALLHPFIFVMFGGIEGLSFWRDNAPQWIQLTGMTFQLAAWIYGGLLLIWGTPGAIVRAIRKLRRLAQVEPKGTAAERALVDENRRRLLAKAALTLPAAVVVTTAGGAIAARQVPQVTRLRLPVPREMTGLHGLTIAQVSDVHVGSYMDAERLDEIRDALNAQEADIVVCTGDLIDNHISQLEEGQRFLKGLKATRGVYMCMGNHEYIGARGGDTAGVIAGLRESGAQLLIDETRKIEVAGSHLWLMGIDYPPQGGTHTIYERATQRTTDESLDEVLAQARDDGAPRILLSHHPRTFVQAQQRPIDLTLSGHTHGGQLVLGRLGDFNVSPVLPFEHYHNGFYEHPSTGSGQAARKLYVNRGVGGWMPVRINCPPEITLIELV